MIEYPEFKEFLLSSSMSYNYKKKIFLQKVFKKIEYFNELPNHDFHYIYLNLRSEYHEKNKVLVKPMNVADTLLIVESGCLEVYTEVEGNCFTLEFLEKGAVLNLYGILIENNS